MENIDDLLRRIEQDEAEDGLELAREGHYRLTPIQYAKARGIRPQRIYSAYRHNKLTKETCQCGRTIVDIDEADEYFGFAKESGNKYGEEE